MRDIPALDGMRGIAATLVVGFHVIVFAVGLDPAGFSLAPEQAPAARNWLSWGFIGVDFFFVLSAFLLAQPFLAKGLAVDWRGYAGKRLLRVVPPYYASILLGWLLVGHTGHPWFAIDWRQLWTHVAFLHSFWGDTHLAVSPVYWTLAIELQFYLLLPLLALPFRGKHWPTALAAALAVTVAYRWWVAQGDGIPELRLREAQMPAYLWHFALGIAMARLRQPLRRKTLRPRALDASIAAAVLACIVLPTLVLRSQSSVFGFMDPWPIVLYRPMVAVGFAVVILLACTGAGRVARFLESPPLRALGAWSYPLYLVHYPVGAFLVLNAPSLFRLSLGELAFVLTVASILVAAAFHRAVEVPALRLKDHVAALRTRRGVIEPPIPSKP